MFGAISFGSLSDRFGRRIVLLVSYVSSLLFAVASAFSTTYVMFAVLRFFTGFCITGIVIISVTLSNSFLICVEWVDIEHRKLVGLIDGLSWSFGNIVFSAIAYFVTDWRWLILSVTSPLILSIITWRRNTEVGALLLVALCLGINIVIPKDMSVVRTVVAVVGKGFSSASFGTVVLYSSELYPTVVRYCNDNL
ncbi:hypothetical protein GOODEAATRI_029185 [Goodea atripinnis]|uniref:Major facilitator superfamily (MFS) profile domain-containing protein n=1 Tax=Goodea atripinnis TaxID=208336 RepID=A0ABV0NG20_9TELE